MTMELWRLLSSHEELFDKEQMLRFYQREWDRITKKINMIRSGRTGHRKEEVKERLVLMLSKTMVLYMKRMDKLYNETMRLRKYLKAQKENVTSTFCP